MSLQSLVVLLPYTDTPIINAQLGTLRRLPTTPKPIGLRWARRRLVVTNAAARRQEPRKEISLDQHDLMALEFGRLLGESKEQTISKVLRRKIDPASTYIGIEKQAKSGKEIISKNDFVVKVERPKRSSVNDSTLGPDLPRLASRPSRQNGLSINLPNKLGTKVASQVDMEEILDDSLLRKPSPSQGSRAAIPQSPFALPVVNNVKRLDSQFTTVMEETIEDLEMLRRPSAATGQGLAGGLLEIDHNTGAKSVKVAALTKPVRVSSSDSAKGSASEGKSVQLDSLQDSAGGLLEIDHNTGAKSVKVAALKKPVRVSSSDSAKGSASEGKSVQLDSLQDSGLSSDVTKQSSDANVKGEERGSGKLDIDRDLKTLEREREVEGIVGSQSLAEPLNTTSFLPEQASLEDQNRDQMIHEQMTAVLAADQNRESILDEASHTEIVSAAKGTAPTATQSKKVLRRPSQLTNAELVAQHSEQMDLQDSNIKLHQAKEEEEKDWAQAEALLKAKEQVEVKLIGSNSGGLFVSFGCLVGFLPLFELSPKRGIVDFGSWAQQKGIDLNQKGEGGLSNGIVNDAGQASTITQNVGNNKPTTVIGEDLNELRNMYKEEVSKLMSSFVGEKTKVIVKILDKSTRKLKFSEKEADPGCQEHVQKKANLMAGLKLGDVVTCEVKSITPIGVFVEVDGVPALIHHSEVSWNTKVDPAALLNVGEVIKAKVCRLDRTLQRISLSLKQMQLDPLKQTLESVVGDSDNDIESIEVVWPELEDLMKKLEQMDHISCVSRGRCLYSSAFAPTFQVLISTPQSNGYKLLARFGNKIQEVLVDTTLDRDKMKECIRLCTFSEA